MKKKVKLLLCENVEKLGIIGDEVNVTAGFAINFLLPNKLAVNRQDHQYKEIIKQIREKRKKIEQELESAKNKLEKAASKKLEFIRKSSEKGKIFGSVTTEDIAKEIGIDKKFIITEPLKSLGEHLVQIKISQLTPSELTVTILAEKENKEKK